MVEIVATFAVYAGTTAKLELEDATDPDLVALYLIEDAGELVDVSVCNQCADGVIDPDIGELTGFTVDGVSYQHDAVTGHWVPADAVETCVDCESTGQNCLAHRQGGGARG